MEGSFVQHMDVTVVSAKFALHVIPIERNLFKQKSHNPVAQVNSIFDLLWDDINHCDYQNAPRDHVLTQSVRHLQMPPVPKSNGQLSLQSAVPLPSKRPIDL